MKKQGIVNSALTIYNTMSMIFPANFYTSDPSIDNISKIFKPYTISGKEVFSNIELQLRFSYTAEIQT